MKIRLATSQLCVVFHNLGLFIISGICFFIPIQMAHAAAGVDPEGYLARYRSRLTESNHLMSKITNNTGDGFEELYGTRNMRAVLHGIYYRGGANNYCHRSNPRDNMNPLPADGLSNLCEEGFGKGIYFYATNFKPTALTCTTQWRLQQVEIHSAERAREHWTIVVGSGAGQRLHQDRKKLPGLWPLLEWLARLGIGSGRGARTVL